MEYDPSAPFTYLAIVRDGVAQTLRTEIEFDQMAQREGLIRVTPMCPYYAGSETPMAAHPQFLRDQLARFDALAPRGEAT